MKVSVVVPVKDGARFLPEQLAALASEGVDEVLVVDSGSVDGSAEIAAAAGARVISIAPAEFGHGRTRNLGAAQTTGDVIAFLTQDATPLPGWRDALVAGFGLASRVGVVYGPHRARADTSPMIARELDAFFASKAGDDGGPRIDVAGGDPWLSNVNAAYLRACWSEVRFDDALAYAEDQAFGVAMLAAGWAKVYAPGMAVLHAHDYPPVQFMRRYFDEYRGLRETIGHVESIGVRSTVRTVRGLVADDRAWMRAQGYQPSQLRRWTARATVHHTGRLVSAALGSRAHRLPAPVQRAVSLEGTASAKPAVRAKAVPAAGPVAFDAVRRYAVSGPAPLLDVLPGQELDTPLHVACVIPHFSRGSGGHNSILQIMWRLEQAGHTVSYWIDDAHGHMDAHRPARVRGDMQEWFAPIVGPVFKGFDDWYGADVAVATGWQTAHSVMLLEGCRARAYLVHDHESEFYPTSVEALWAEQTYGLGMHAVCGSPWLASLISSRYGGTTSLFQFGVDHDVYRPRAVERASDVVAFYGRESTARRAVPLALMALQEVVAARPGLRVLSFGSDVPLQAPFPHEHLGVLSHDELASLFSMATVGVVLSMTNYSLIPGEMMACGLPCVDLAGVSAEGVFGADGPVALSAPDPVALAGVIARLLGDPAERASRSDAGLAFVAGRTWDVAAGQVEAGLREALRLRR
jgi:glycosyltransferase involved in cell wall biosynthesis/GT2 family glycosyltransferase